LQDLGSTFIGKFNTKFNTHPQLTLGWPVPAVS
jgi:hypothetical protein